MKGHGIKSMIRLASSIGGYKITNNNYRLCKLIHLRWPLYWMKPELAPCSSQNMDVADSDDSLDSAVLRNIEVPSSNS